MIVVHITKYDKSSILPHIHFYYHQFRTQIVLPLELENEKWMEIDHSPSFFIHDHYNQNIKEQQNNKIGHAFYKQNDLFFYFCWNLSLSNKVVVLLEHAIALFECMFVVSFSPASSSSYCCAFFFSDNFFFFFSLVLFFVSNASIDFSFFFHHHCCCCCCCWTFDSFVLFMCVVQVDSFFLFFFYIEDDLLLFLSFFCWILCVFIFGLFFRSVFFPSIFFLFIHNVNTNVNNCGYISNEWKKWRILNNNDGETALVL